MHLKVPACAIGAKPSTLEEAPCLVSSATSASDAASHFSYKANRLLKEKLKLRFALAMAKSKHNSIYSICYVLLALFSSGLMAEPAPKSLSLEQLRPGFYRLRIFGAQKVSLEGTERIETYAKCGSKSALTLKIRVDASVDWLKSVAEGIEDPPESLCDYSLSPRSEEGSYDLRLFYRGENTNLDFERLSFKTGIYEIVDHWYTGRESVSQKSKRSGSRKATGSMPQEFQQNFLNEEKWEKTLESLNTLTRLRSGLERLREEDIEVDRGVPTLSVERQEFVLPYVELPLMPYDLKFEEKPFEISDFGRDEIPKQKKAKAKEIDAVDQGLNFIVHLVKSKEWLKAREAMSVLEKSKLKKFIPYKLSKWWALKGQIYFKTSELIEKEDDRAKMRRESLNIWRDGLRLTQNTQGEHRAYSEFMLNALLNSLVKEGLYFAALSVSEWALRQSWTEEILERLNYLKPLNLFYSGFPDEAAKLFREFFEDRVGLAVYQLSDRRLTPAAGLWAGDIYFRAKNMKQALKEYTETIEKFPSARKVPFENEFYPDTIKDYPEILFNRSEAYVRLGFEQKALRDLRAFINFSPNHPAVGMAFYRIGDLLRSLDPQSKKATDAWRECALRVVHTLGGKLCRARLTAEEIKNPLIRKDQWARMIGNIDDVSYPPGQKPEAVSVDDLEVYKNMIIADAMIFRNEPDQAWLRLDGLKKLVPSDYLRAWLNEFQIVALSGRYELRNREGNFHEVIKDYERRRKELLLHFARHEVLYFVSEAFTGLKLEDAAHKTLEIAETSKKKIDRPSLRPFEKENKFWDVLRARLLVEKSKKDIRVFPLALAELKKTDPGMDSAVEAWILYSKYSKDTSQEADWWLSAEKTSGLSWMAVDRASEVMFQSGRLKEARELLESRVVPQIEGGLKSASGPNVQSVFRLAKVRAKLGFVDEALVALQILEIAPKELFTGSSLTYPAVLFEKASILKSADRRAAAKEIYEKVKLVAPGTIYDGLSSVAIKELNTL